MVIFVYSMVTYEVLETADGQPYPAGVMGRLLLNDVT